jgi:hypothetical protein
VDTNRETEWGAEPLHVFRGRSRTGPDLLVYADHLELHSGGGRDVVALWYRHIHRLMPSQEPGGEALAIVDRGGQVLLAPMARDDAITAQRFIGSVMEKAESRRRMEALAPGHGTGRQVERFNRGRSR